MSGLPTIVHASQAPGGQQCFTQLVHAHQNGLRTEALEAERLMVENASVSMHASSLQELRARAGAV